MGNAIVALISVAIMLSGMALMAQATFKSADIVADAWQQMEVRSGDIARTGLQVLTTSHSGGSADVNITLRNSGQTPLRDFESWDVVVQYYETDGTYHQPWLPYAGSYPPGNNQWAVKGIYADAQPETPEVFQPGILDPGEEVIIRLRLAPAPSNPQEHRVTIGTLNGVSVSTMF